VTYSSRFVVHCAVLVSCLWAGETHAQLESPACIPIATQLTQERDSGQITSVQRAVRLRDCHRALPGYTSVHEQYWLFFIQTASLLDSGQISKSQANELLAQKRRELESRLSSTEFASPRVAPKSLACRPLPYGQGFTCDEGVECRKYGPVGPLSCTGFGSDSSSVGCTPLPNGVGFSCDNGMTCMRYGPVGPLTCN
jgi:hypothetical protein